MGRQGFDRRYLIHDSEFGTGVHRQVEFGVTCQPLGGLGRHTGIRQMGDRRPSQGVEVDNRADLIFVRQE